MTDHEGELRGSTPVYTAKDILVSLDRKVSDLDIKMDGFGLALQVLISQNLNERMVKLELDGSPSGKKALDLAIRHEALVNKLEGAGIIIRILVGINVVTLAGVAVAIGKAFGIQL